MGSPEWRQGRSARLNLQNHWRQTKRAAAFRQPPSLYAGLGVERSGGGLHLLGRNRDAAGERLSGVAGELEHRFGVLRGFGDIGVEGAANEIALQLEELGR